MKESLYGRLARAIHDHPDKQVSYRGLMCRVVSVEKPASPGGGARWGLVLAFEFAGRRQTQRVGARECLRILAELEGQ